MTQIGIKKEAKCVTRRSFLLLISQTHEIESGLVRATNNMGANPAILLSHLLYIFFFKKLNQPLKLIPERIEPKALRRSTLLCSKPIPLTVH